MQMASHGTTLHIDRVEQGHAGLFSCQATNEAGTAGAEVELSVHGEGAWEARTASGGSGGPGRDVELVLSGQCFWAGLLSSPKGCDMRGWSWPFTTSSACPQALVFLSTLDTRTLFNSLNISALSPLSLQMLFSCLEHSAFVPASSSLSFGSVLKHPFLQEALRDSTMVLIHTAQPLLAIAHLPL